jgi:DNA polymerase (family 10)
MKTVHELAAILAELAIFLELKGENPFKIKAYRQAARTLEASSQTLEETLKQPPAGFGKGLQEKLAEFSATGHIKEHDELQREIPAGFLDLLAIQGLGPKKIRVLHETLGITSLDTLEQAIQKNLLVPLKGFGAKSQANIRDGLAFVREGKGKFLLIEAEMIAGEILEYLRRRFPELPILVAGSLRRRKEVVKDADLLVGSDASAPIMQALVAHPRVDRVLSQGDTKASVLMLDGLQVDLRVVPPESMGTALCHFTGSREHNTRLRALALQQGMKLNEYGLYKDETTAAYAEEADVFAALGLPPIPPELREDMGEIEWAQRGEIPVLVEEHDLKGILHIHTTASDGRCTLEEIAEAAATQGYSYAGICDHSQSAHYAGGLSIEEVKAQWQAIDDWNRRHSPFRLLKGIECDIRPDGTLDYPDDILAGFDFVIASVHSGFHLSADEMTARLERAMQNPFLDIIGHISGRILLEREGYPLHWDRVLSACAAAKVMIEINANPRRLDIDWQHIRSAPNRDVTYSIGVDAHDLRGLTDGRFGIGVARKGALSAKHIVNCLPTREFLSAIRRRRSR